MKMLLRISVVLIISLAPLATAAKFSVSFAREQSAEALDGRLLLIVSSDPSAEPRMQVGAGPNTQMLFGIDVDGLQPNQETLVDDRAFGYPIRALSDVKPGHYWVQAVLHRYETFHLADGHTVKLPMDRGEGQHWNIAPGNLYSKPLEVTLDAAGATPVKIAMDQKIPPIAEPKDTKYIKHVRIKSELLSKFWGRPMYLGAHVLLPEGFEEHPDARFPLAVFHGHFPSDLSGFRTEPPDPNLKPDYSERFHLGGYNRIEQQEAYAFYQQWISPKFPRFLVMEIQHPTPYYDDSYAVNSANMGPYGDAIETELIPYVEKQFHGIGQGWARFLYGGSTGGWEALAVQMFYPEHYNGTFAACPDPVDFRGYTVVDIYKDKNAYFIEGPHKRVAQPGMRDYLGHVSVTLQDLNFYELALGSKGRSGEQWDIWQAVFSPMGPEGYPAEIWNKMTGDINPAIAGYWREHYDLSYILKRDWNVLGPKLRGKIHIYVGSADNYFLNDAVYYIEDFLKGTQDPPYEGEVKYGERAEHCWNGDPALPNAISRLHYNTLYLPKMLERMEKASPPGADLKSWRY